MDTTIRRVADLGSAVRDRRKQLGYSQARTAELCGTGARVKLEVLQFEQIIGELESTPDRGVVVRYRPEYAASPGAVPISQSPRPALRSRLYDLLAGPGHASFHAFRAYLSIAGDNS